MIHTMELQFFCPRWGSEDLDWELFFEKVREEGYDGVEYGIGNQADEKELDRVWRLAEKYGMKLIAQCYDTGEADFLKHKALYEAWFQKIKAYPVVKINTQTGRDIFSFEQNRQLIDVATRFTRDTGTAVVHETHRNKCLFAAHIAAEYLTKLPDLNLTMDLSHWVCVAETFLEDQAAAVQLAIEKAGHLHARVGYSQGPQIPDPRAAEWSHALDAHLNWWDQFVRRKQAAGETITITPEFGPYPYMVHLPGVQTPIADQWAVNGYMMQLLKQRYQDGRAAAL
ncbi:sugar phosphate isomerase/epimerase family protein [Niabella hirudinis]|uniref:sugar phosphate isomerase/epimerase family protein n=1 Tax=Niabella hirudinis TaxID=1285929 RepID=UPI003EC04BC0